jgi:glycosyltransferase involved in cell wall biosynthesis
VKVQDPAYRPCILLAANSAWNLTNFRKPLIVGLKKAGYRLAAAVPKDEAAKLLADLGVEVHHVTVDARGMSPVRDFRLFLSYRRLLRRLRPGAVLAFTPKPNIYGSLAAAAEGIPFINTITGLGTGFLSGPGLQTIISGLYRLALRRSQRVFFHNADDRALFIKRKLIRAGQAAVVAGSGIDLAHFSPAPPRAGDEPVAFLFIGRLLKDKGTSEFLRAAEILAHRRAARLRILGPAERHPKALAQEVLQRALACGRIEYLESVDDVRPFIASADCIVLPSYREGLPRVLLEAGAMARPVIATDVPGCRQAVDHNVTGLLCEARSAESLAEAMIVMSDLSPVRRAAMGKRAREKVRREFSEERVVTAYVEALRELYI